jgi:hypothetical protein
MGDKCVRSFEGKPLGGGDAGKTTSTRERMILKEIFRKWEDMTAVLLSRDEDQFRDVANTAMNLKVALIGGGLQEKQLLSNRSTEHAVSMFEQTA